MKSRLREEFYRINNQGKRAAEEAERRAEDEAKRRRRQQAREMLEEAARLKAAEPVKIEMKGFAMAAKAKQSAPVKSTG